MPASSMTAVRHDSCHRTEQLSAWRSRLVEERSFLLDQRVLLDAELKAFPVLAGDETRMSLRAAVRAAVAEVDDALTRMDDGQYGSCVQCSQPIPTERLDALRMASLCPPCHRIHQERVRATAAIEAKPRNDPVVEVREARRYGRRGLRMLSTFSSTPATAIPARGVDARGER
jgi:DnaK suppressor protein